MNRERTLDSTPCDLFLEIISRLPAKSIGRCRCVSRLWGSMIRGPYFTELFLTRSSARPRVLFAVKRDREWLFFSSPHPQNLYEKWPLVVATDFHTKFSEDINEYICRYSSGLIHFSDRWISKEEVICNPITGQYTILPKLMSYGVSRSVVVFDPIDKHHKVFRMNSVCYNETVHYIMTLGTEKLTWRKIQCRPLSYRDGHEGICINGVYYYFAVRTDKEYYETHVIVCFDVRSEIFKFIEVESFYNSQLMNYKGKLVAINLTYNDSGGRLHFELHTWVLEDVDEKHESSKCVNSNRVAYVGS
ncbi:putative F-box protein At5g42430 [Arabidopsis lyrata subsp. lyrata]|nr:putative F-box protein At5g42430 [Arabidopsis lyrata subsp. lyrata]|eukprot:XP_002891475.2 putative F-box protein At5g42430 [Arabidopsis lyrata subsp. lyrata]